MSQIVKAVFAHPDDEVLACGASLSMHANRGDQVRILLLATGLTARGTATASDLSKLRKFAQQATDVMGADVIEFADFPDNAMDSVPLLDVVQRVESFLDGPSASVIYTHHGGDLNIDHRITHQAVVTACRPLPGLDDLALLACEVNSSTEWSVDPSHNFQPTEFADITITLAQKTRALECYGSEMRQWPHPRSIEGVIALARWRGSQAGYEAAEAFVTLRRTREASGGEHK